MIESMSAGGSPAWAMAARATRTNELPDAVVQEPGPLVGRCASKDPCAAAVGLYVQLTPTRTEREEPSRRVARRSFGQARFDLLLPMDSRPADVHGSYLYI